VKILIAEDDMVSRCLLEELLLGWGHEVMVAEDGESAMAVVMRHAPFDVAILDWMMPGVAGVSVCKAIREQEVERHPFVLMLTAKSQLEDIVGGLDAGADEYLTKPYRPAELAARLRAAQRFLRVQDDLIGARRLVAYHAEHDVLTGAWNRAALIQKLHGLLEERRRRPSPMSVLRADISGFSQINEKHGVGVGDEILRLLAERLRGLAPMGSTIGRNGPDEFMVLLGDADEETAAVVAAGVAHGVRISPFQTSGGAVTVSVDVGVVTAQLPAELELGWLLSALDAITWVGTQTPRSTANTFELAIAV
jgi:diguanylate cyclase (GGDEF)-like protein